MAKMTLQERIERTLSRSKADVFVRKDFERLGDYDQVGRGLRRAARKGLVVRAGYGVYVRARPSALTGKPVPVLPLVEVGMQALAKIGVKAGMGRSAAEYSSGASTQMPMATALSVGKSRVTRKIGFGRQTLRYER